MTLDPFSMMHQERERVMADPGLSGIFVNPITGNIWSEGDVYTFPSLGATLRFVLSPDIEIIINGHPQADRDTRGQGVLRGRNCGQPGQGYSGLTLIPRLFSTDPLSRLLAVS